ncbi:hypothetical protein Tco_0967455 [Tanacetum coccineum]
MEYRMAAYLMTILENLILHEEFREEDHYEYGLLVDGASWSIEVDTGEPVGSAGLGAAAKELENNTGGRIEELIKNWLEQNILIIFGWWYIRWLRNRIRNEFRTECS